MTDFHRSPRCLPLLTSTESSTDETMCETARQVISRTLKVEPTLYDEGDVRELQRQPDLFYRRQGKSFDWRRSPSLDRSFQRCLAQRREEFQQMVNLVHQQVPQASIEAIRYDLGEWRRISAFIGHRFHRSISFRSNKECRSNNCKSKGTSSGSDSSGKQSD